MSEGEAIKRAEKAARRVNYLISSVALKQKSTRTCVDQGSLNVSPLVEKNEENHC